MGNLPVLLTIFLVILVIVMATVLYKTLNDRIVGGVDSSLTLTEKNDEELLGLKNFRKCLFTHINKLTGLPIKALEGVFVKWIFNENIRLGLDNNFIPLDMDNFIDENDIKFLCQRYGKKYPPGITNSFKIPLRKFRLNSKIPPVKLIPLEGEKGYNIFVSDTENMNLTKRQFNRLKSLNIHKDNESAFLHDAFYLLNVYNTLGGLNNLASIPIGWCPNAIELFGSPLNTQYQYCSAFPFEVKLFNSLGSFFKYTLVSDQLYIANPPFDESTMEGMANRLIGSLEKIPRISVVIVLPVWDPESQDKMGIKNYKTPFKAYDLLKASKFFKHDELMDRQTYKFFDYNKDQYVPLSNFHLILFNNYESSDSLNMPQISQLKEEWEKITNPPVSTEGLRSL